MGAVWMWARSDLRRRWVATVVLGLLVGVAGAVVLTGAAGARRTASSYDRFLRASRVSDVYLFTGEVTSEQLRKFANVPYITALAPAQTLQIQLPNGDFPNVGAPFDRRFGTLVERPRIIAGRAANPRSAKELVVAEPFATQHGLRVGDSYTLRSYTPAQVDALKTGAFDSFPEPGGPTVRMRVVGISLLPSDLSLSGARGGIVVLTPAFLDRYGPRIGSYAGDVAGVRLRNGTGDVARFIRRARAYFGSSDSFAVQPLGESTAGVTQSIDLLALGAALFALVATIAGVTAIGLVLARRVDDSSRDQDALRSLGLTRTQRAVAVGLTALPSVALGALVAVLGAWLASPLFPMGLAADAEPDPGIHLDGPVLGLGVVAMVLVLLGIVALLAWRTARVTTSARVPSHTTLAARAAAGLGVHPAASLGVRMALEPGHGSRRVPVRAALVGTVAAVLGITGATVFAASLQRMERTPALYGFNWDARVLDTKIRPSVADHPCTVEQSRLARVRGVAAVASICSISTVLGGRPVTAFGLTSILGSIEPTVVEGRAPRTAGEVALGAHALSAIDRRLGDRVSGVGPGGPVDYRIVGVVAAPRFDDEFSDPLPVDDGAFFTGAGLDALDDPTDIDSSVEWLVRVDPRDDPDAVLARVERLRGIAGFDGGPGVQRALTPVEIQRLVQIDALPVVLAAFLGLLGLVSVGFVLVTSIRRRRRDLAIVKTLGFSRRQVSATVAWQATTIGIVGALVGIPLGVAIGRAIWSSVARGIGVVATPDVPIVALAVVAITAVLAANFIAAVPAWAAARTRPATVLRSE